MSKQRFQIGDVVRTTEGDGTVCTTFTTGSFYVLLPTGRTIMRTGEDYAELITTTEEEPYQDGYISQQP